MVVGPVKFSLPIDPGAAQAQLRRDQMEEKRVRVDVKMKMTTTTEQKPNGKTDVPQQTQSQSTPPAASPGAQSPNSRTPQVSPTTPTPSSGRRGAAQPDATPQRVGPSIPPPLEGNRSVAPQSTDDDFPTVQPGESLEDAREREGKQSDASPDANPDDADKFPTIRPGENLDQAKARHAQEQGKTVRKGETPDQANIRHAREEQARNAHKQSYKPQPPLQTPPSPQNTGAPNPEEQDRSAADRQANAADDKGDYAAQARARGEQARTNKKANAKAPASSDDAQSEGTRAILNVLIHGGSVTGVATTVSESAMGFQFLRTIFPAFNDRMQSSIFDKWLPQKFDLTTASGWGDLIVCIAEVLLFILFIVSVVIIGITAYAVMTNPMLGLKAIFSVFLN